MLSSFQVVIFCLPTTYYIQVACPTTCGHGHSWIHGPKEVSCRANGQVVAESRCLAAYKPSASCTQACAPTASCCSSSQGQYCSCPNESGVATYCLDSSTGSRVGGCNEPGRFRTCSGPIAGWSLNPRSPAYGACAPYGGCHTHTNCHRHSSIGCNGHCQC